MAIQKQLYVGFQTTRYQGEQLGRTLGFMCPYGDSKSAKSRMATVDRWRDKNIEPKIYDNIPLSGFKVVDFARRWSTSNKLIRVEDPRGFELEITIPNFLDLVPYITLVKGTIVEKLVWNGNTLLSVDDPRYQQEVKPVVVEAEVGKYYTNKAKTMTYKYLGKFYARQESFTRTIRTLAGEPYQWKYPGYSWYNRESITQDFTLRPESFNVVVDIKAQERKDKLHLYAYQHSNLGEVWYDARTTLLKDLVEVDEEHHISQELENSDLKCPCKQPTNFRSNLAAHRLILAADRKQFDDLPVDLDYYKSVEPLTHSYRYYMKDPATSGLDKLKVKVLLNGEVVE